MKKLNELVEALFDPSDITPMPADFYQDIAWRLLRPTIGRFGLPSDIEMLDQEMAPYIKKALESSYILKPWYMLFIHAFLKGGMQYLNIYVNDDGLQEARADLIRDLHRGARHLRNEQARILMGFSLTPREFAAVSAAGLFKKYSFLVTSIEASALDRQNARADILALIETLEDL